MSEDKKKRLKRFQTDVGKIRQRAERFSSGSFWNPKAGTNKIRILPPWNDEGIFYKEVVWHYGFNVGGQARAFQCIKSMGGIKCPACQVVARFNDEKDDDIKAIVQKMKPKAKWFMNIIDRKMDDGEVKIFGASFTVARDVLAYFSDEDYGDITDPTEGRDVIIEREGMGFTTKYSVRIGAKPTAIGIEGWDQKLHDLNTETIREVLSGKKMLELLEQLYGETLDLSGISYDVPKLVKKEEAEEEGDDDEETPPVKKTKPKKPVTPAAEEDDSDLGDDDE